MELKQFQYFVVSVDMGSLSKAAEILYTSQPHVSKTIQGLEQELGLALLERGKHGVALTKDGKKVYEQARKIIKNANMISDMTAQIEHKELRLSSMPSNMLAGIFAAFYQQQKGLRVKFLEGSLETVLHQVSHRQVEVGFVFVPENQKQVFNNMINHRHLEFSQLKETKLVLFVGPKNRYYNRKSISVAELEQLEYVQDLEEEIPLLNYPGHLRGEVAEHEHLRKMAVVGNDYVMMRLLLDTELGNIGSLLDQAAMSKNGIRAIELEDCEVKIDFGYVKRSDRTLSEDGVRVTNHIAEKLKLSTK